MGSIIFTVDATDEDSGRNELINYELQMPSVSLDRHYRNCIALLVCMNV